MKKQETPPGNADKFCRSCKEYKHRQEFYHRLSGAWDTMCRACQAKPKPLQVHRERMIKGLISRLAFNKIENASKDNTARVAARNLRHWKEETRARTWERAERSAVITIKVLNGVPCASEAEHEWREDVRELVTTTLQNIRDKKKKEFAPLDHYLFWYDVDREAAQKLRKMIDEFPGTNCPLRMMR